MDYITDIEDVRRLTNKDKKLLNTLLLMRSELKTLPNVEWNIRRVVTYCYCSDLDDADGIYESIMISRDELADDLQSAYDETVKEISKRDFKDSFWSLHNDLSSHGKRRFWGDIIDYDVVCDVWLPWEEDQNWDA
jgi:hypothetical protein